MTDEDLTRSEVINTFGSQIGRVLIDAGFSTLTPLAEMSRDELEEIDGIGPAYAQTIWELFTLGQVNFEEEEDAEEPEAENGEKEIESPHAFPPPPRDSLVAGVGLSESQGTPGPYRVEPQDLPPASPRIQRIRESVGEEAVDRAHGFTVSEEEPFDTPEATVEDETFDEPVLGDAEAEVEDTPEPEQESEAAEVEEESEAEIEAEDAPEEE